MISEHDRVALTEDVQEKSLKRGDVGTVISVHGDGQAYTVEFMTVGGRTVAIVTLPASRVRAVLQDEMQQTRPLAV